MKFRCIIPTAFLLAGFQACSPVKGYYGAERPDNELSIITTSTSDNLSWSSENVSGFDMGIAGISVLPGPQEFSGVATLTGEAYNCRPYTEFDSSGFYNCEDEKRRKNQYNNCDCYDYLTVHESCDQLLKESNCRASFNTKADRRYDIKLGLKFGTPVVGVIEQGSWKEIGTGKCTYEGQRTTNLDRYVGSGRRTANQAGFYSCRGY